MHCQEIYMKTSKGVVAGLVALVLCAASAMAQVRDQAGFFSPGAVEQANKSIGELKQQHKKDLLIETLPAVPDEQKDAFAAKGKERFFSDYSAQRAKASGIDGIYILISKDPSYLKVAVGNNTARRAFTTANRDDLARQMLNSFRSRNYDQALSDAVTFVRETISRNNASAPAAAPMARSSNTPAQSSPSTPAPRRSPGMSGLLFWVILILGGFFVIRMLGRLFSHRTPYGPNDPQQQGQPPYGGYGQGGYGGQGGGFGRGILGGLLGGMAGGWMYDQYRHRGQGNMDTSAGGSALPPTDPSSWSDQHDTDFSSSSGGDFSSGGGEFGGGGDSGGGGDF
jgi:uncharacterized protein